MQKTMYGIVGFLAFVGVGASIAHYMQEPYNPGFLDHPYVTAIHIIPGGLYLCLAPLQFLKGFRQRFPQWHRWSGRLLSVTALFIGSTAAFLAIFVPFSGWPERIVNGFFSVVFLVCIVNGFRYIRVKNIALHREWMMRAFAIGLSIATMRVIMVPAIMYIGKTTGEVTYQTAANVSIICFTISFLLHCAVVEWWIRRTRGKEPALPAKSAPATV